MKTAIIAKFLFDEEDLVALKDMGVVYESKTETIGRLKIPCYKFFNIDENGVFDKLDIKNISKISLSEAGTNLDKTFSSRAWSVIFTQIRKVNALPDDGAKVGAVCALLSTCVSMATLDTNLANRILQLIRNL